MSEILVGTQSLEKIARANRGGHVGAPYVTGHRGAPGGRSLCRTSPILYAVDDSTLPEGIRATRCGICFEQMEAVT